jgi:hypothetical protein
MLMISTGSMLTISSVRPYFSLNGAFFLKSEMAIQSSGESLGTQVTTPVPLFMEMVIIGREKIFYLTANGALNGRPIISEPFSLQMT